MSSCYDTLFLSPWSTHTCTQPAHTCLNSQGLFTLEMESTANQSSHCTNVQLVTKWGFLLGLLRGTLVRSRWGLMQAAPSPEIAQQHGDVSWSLPHSLKAVAQSVQTCLCSLSAQSSLATVHLFSYCRGGSRVPVLPSTWPLVYLLRLMSLPFFLQIWRECCSSKACATQQQYDTFQSRTTTKNE